MLHTVWDLRLAIISAHAALEGHIDGDVISADFELFEVAHLEAPDSTQ